MAQQPDNAPKRARPPADSYDTPRKSPPRRSNAPGGQKKSPPRASGGRRTNSRQPDPTIAENQRRNCEIAGVLLIALGLFFALTFMEFSGILGSGIRGFLFGLLGSYAYALPAVLIAYGIYSIALAGGGNLSGKTLLVVGTSLCVTAILHVRIGSQLQTTDFVEFIVVSFRTGESSHVGGGLFGGLLSFGTLIFMGTGGTYLLYSTLIVIQLIVLTNLSLYKAGVVLQRSVKANFEQMSAGLHEQRALRRQEQQARHAQMLEQRALAPTQPEEDGLPPHDTRTYGTPDQPRGKAGKQSNRPFNFNELELGQMSKGLAEKMQSDFVPFSDALPPLEQDVDFESFARFAPKVPADFCIDEPVPINSRFGSYLNYDFDAHGAPKTQTPPAQDPEQDLPPPSGEPHVAEPCVEEPSLEESTAQGDEIPAPAFEQPQVNAPDVPTELEYDIDAGEYERFLPPKPFFPPRQSSNGAIKPPAVLHASAIAQTVPQAQPPVQTVQIAQSAQRILPQPPPAPQQAVQPMQQTAAHQQPVAQMVVKLSHYVPPPLSILKPANHVGISPEDSAEKAKLLEDTLASFGISAKVVNVTQGPVITRFELQPAAGVRVNRITNLADDLALNLAAQRVRIEAPIPGKAVIGIEIPNKTILPVLLHELVSSEEFIRHASKACVCLGKDIAGNNALADLSKMPHLLIAGSTGSGKSVCINCIICSIIYHATPEDVKLIMVDPKVVELAQFANIPHLLIPVVTEPKKAASALKWAVQEMVTRYKRFAEVGARDLARFNELTMAQGAAKTPLIIVIVDELADLMMVAADDVEDAVCRIAQMGRAAGIHLVIATQRPSTDVITGLIKANVPSRIAFAVASATDSRIILDSGGAEKLLGRGDMLFSPIGASKPMRVQGALVTDEEVERIHEYFKTHQFGDSMQADVMEAVESGNIPSDDGSGEGIFEDELLPQAVSLFLSSGTASISMLQRRFRVGYARAARIVDIMEQMGIVSGFEGSKPRKLLINRAEYERIFGVPPEIADLGT